MSIAKLDEFKQIDQDLALYFKVLSHPARLAILTFLAEQKTCISGDISEFIPLARTTVSQHLQELKESGLINSKAEGKKISYCINSKEFKKLKNMIEPFINNIEYDCNC